MDRSDELVQDHDHAACSLAANYMLTWDEIANLAAEPGKPAETLMNVVALIARRFGTDVCSAYLLEPDRANLVLAATLGKGDVITIPAKTPHWFKEVPTTTIAYYAVNIESD